ncbi:MAG TPA: hypothetical protein ENH25_01700, partial [candidate division Zixibacteria bacterium]|nr:hypothetical protein [candidate division Zixibacteria bacterium]
TIDFDTVDGTAKAVDGDYTPTSGTLVFEPGVTTRTIVVAILDDSDAEGDGIDEDGDGSGTPGDNPCTGGETENCDDNCPYAENPDQSDIDTDGIGDVCDSDADGDGCNQDGDGSGTPGDNPCTGGETENCDDNCPFADNSDQADEDSDGVGDVCDNCQNIYNSEQSNYDNDDYGDLCDSCTDIDGDGYGDPEFPLNVCPEDNCPPIYNPDQTDSNDDGVGDACDWLCGDVNNDGSINILDITYIINYLYKGGPAPIFPEASDVDNSGSINILDISYIISYLYKGGPEPECS